MTTNDRSAGNALTAAGNAPATSARPSSSSAPSRTRAGVPRIRRAWSSRRRGRRRGEEGRLKTLSWFPMSRSGLPGMTWSPCHAVGGVTGYRSLPCTRISRASREQGRIEAVMRPTVGLFSSRYRRLIRRMCSREWARTTSSWGRSAWCIWRRQTRSREGAGRPRWTTFACFFTRYFPGSILSG